MARKVVNQGTRISDHYIPTERQKVFHESKAIYRLYGGAKGGGKSLAIVWEAVGTCLRIPGCNVLILRRTYPELQKGIERLFEQVVPKNFYKKRNLAEHTVIFANGSKLYFGSAQHERDIEAYQGNEYVAIYIDESTEFSWEMFQFIEMQNRCPIKKDTHGQPVVPFIALCSNPLGVGHDWHKALFIDKAAYRDMTNYDPKKYEYIPAKLKDNPHLAHDKNYVAKLESKPEAWKKAYLEGSWDLITGGYFTHFDRSLTVAEEALGISKHELVRMVNEQRWHPKWIGIDWGYSHCSAVFWGSKLTLASGRDVTVIYRELVCNQTGEEDLAKMIASQSMYDANGKVQIENIAAVYLSPDAFAKKGSSNTISEMIGNTLTQYGLPYPVEADDDRLGGARLLDEMLSKRPDPDLLISEACEELLDTIPTLQRDPKEIEKVQKTERRSDDIYDGWRYCVKSHLNPGEMPFSVKRAQILAECSTNQERFFTDLSLQQRRKQRLSPFRRRWGNGRLRG